MPKPPPRFVRGNDARRAAEVVHRQARVVGQRWQPGDARGVARLEDGVLDEGQAGFLWLHVAELADGALRIGVGNLAADTPRVLEWLNARGQTFAHLVTERPDLETVFLTLTGRKLRDS